MKTLTEILVLWLIIALAVLIWGTLFAAYVYQEWTWPWEASKDWRAITAFFTMFISPVLSTVIVLEARGK